MICQKCGGEISNDFSHTLSFCTNCGERLNFAADKTLEFDETPTVFQPPGKRGFNKILWGSSAVVLLLSLSAGLYFMFPRTANKIISTAPVIKSLTAIDAGEISKITLFQSGHAGPLVGSDDSYSFQSETSFSSDGAAYRMTGKKSYDTGKKQGSEGQIYQSRISAENFANLAQIIAENDFFNETDARGNITDTTETRLTVKYSKGEKFVITSNTGKDTPEIKAILEAFQKLEKQTDWKAVQ